MGLFSRRKNWFAVSMQRGLKLDSVFPWHEHIKAGLNAKRIEINRDIEKPLYCLHGLNAKRIEMLKWNMAHRP